MAELLLGLLRELVPWLSKMSAMVVAAVLPSVVQWMSEAVRLWLGAVFRRRNRAHRHRAHRRGSRTVGAESEQSARDALDRVTHEERRRREESSRPEPSVHARETNRE